MQRAGPSALQMLASTWPGSCAWCSWIRLPSGIVSLPGVMPGSLHQRRLRRWCQEGPCYVKRLSVWSSTAHEQHSWLVLVNKDINRLVYCLFMKRSMMQFNGNYNTRRMKTIGQCLSPPPRRLCFHRCLFVCWLAGLRKTTRPVFTELSGKMARGPW